MRVHKRRILIVCAVSALGFGLNEVVFYRLAPEEENRGNEKPIAFVVRTIDENNRKGEDSPLWNELSEGDPLYRGDRVRTSEKGNLQLQFADSDKLIDIEPDSLLELQATEGKINLSLLDGNLFVKDAKKSDGDDGGATEIVIAGKNGEQIGTGAPPAAVAGSGAALEIVYPKADDGLYLNPENPQAFRFQWKNLRRDLALELRVGPSRKQMRPIGKIPQGNEAVEVPARLGFLYWQFVAKDGDGKEVFATPVTRHEVKPRYAPGPVFPADKGLVRLKSAGDPVELKWFKPADDESVLVEVFADPGMKKAVASEQFTDKDTHALKGLASGTYFWRLKGHSKGMSQTSRLYSFTVNTRAEVKVALEWDGETETVQSYIDQPLVNLAWKAAGPARSYRVRLAAEGDSIEAAVPQIVNDPRWSAKLPKPGRYVAMVEALDDEAEKIGAVGPRRFEIKPRPLLRSIALVSHPEEVITTDGDGNVSLKWRAVDEAESYKVTLVGNDGRILQEETVSSPDREIRDLLPGEYRLTIVGIDRFGRVGEKGVPYVVVVPESAALERPKVRKVEVE